MGEEKRLSVGQLIGGVIFMFSTGIPGLSLAGFHGGTGWSLIGWLFIAMLGGTVGGALLAPKHRLAGAVGGFIAGPMGLLAIYFYARGRTRIHRIEAVLVQLIASLPGLGVYFLLRLLTDSIFPARRNRYDEDEDEDDRPRRRRRPRDDEDDEDDDAPPRRRRARYEDDDDEPPRRRRRTDDDDDDDPPPKSPRHKRRRDEDD